MNAGKSIFCKLSIALVVVLSLLSTCFGNYMNIVAEEKITYDKDYYETVYLLHDLTVVEVVHMGYKGYYEPYNFVRVWSYKEAINFIPKHRQTRNGYKNRRIFKETLIRMYVNRRRDVGFTIPVNFQGVIEEEQWNWMYYNNYVPDIQWNQDVLNWIAPT